MVSIEVLTHRTNGFAGMHAAGFNMYRRALSKRLDVESRTSVYTSLSDMQRMLRQSEADLVLVISDWSAKVEELAEVFEHARTGRAGRKLVYFDTFDGTNSPYFGLLPQVDAFLKSKLLVPVERNLDSFEGGFIFTDFCRKAMDWDIGGWTFGSRPARDQLSKIVPGWSYAVTRSLRNLIRVNRLVSSKFSSRPIQLHVRITPPAERMTGDWYAQYRTYCANSIESLRTRWVCTSAKRISPIAYLREMRRCKLVFSPFGWGELCLRDFEAICSGCLLIKPDMSHVQSSPDMFTPGETYVPLKWDLSDLAEVCEKYLTDTKEAARIARNAQERLHAYFERGGFVESVRSLLNAVALPNGMARQSVSSV